MRKDLHLGNPQQPVVQGGSERYGQWLKERPSVASFLALEDEWRKALDETPRSENPLHLLDAGSGNGMAFFPVAEALAQGGRVVDATLVDIQSDAFVDLDKQVFPPTLKVYGEVGNITDLRFDSKSQDGVYCRSVLPWLGNEADVLRAIKEFKRVLKPGGLVYLNVMGPYNNSSINNIPGVSTEERVIAIKKYILDNPDDPYVYWNPKYERDIAYLTGRVLNRMAIDAGFQDIQLAAFRNPTYPNKLNDDNYPDGFELIARK